MWLTDAHGFKGTKSCSSHRSPTQDEIYARNRGVFLLLLKAGCSSSLFLQLISGLYSGVYFSVQCFLCHHPGEISPSPFDTHWSAADGTGGKGNAVEFPGRCF